MSEPQIFDNYLTLKTGIKAWLLSESKSVHLTVAARAILRGLPIPISLSSPPWREELGLDRIALLRHALAAAVASHDLSKTYNDLPHPHLQQGEHLRRASGFEAGRLWGSRDIADAIFKANGPIDSDIVTGLVIQVARGDGLFLSPSASAGVPEHYSQTIKAMKADYIAIADGKSIVDAPLWHDENPLIRAWQSAKKLLKEEKSGSFWTDWYQRVLDGTPQNWDFLGDVADIEETVWKAGGTTLDKQISSLREKHLLSATYNGERIDFDTESGKFLLVAETQISEKDWSYVRRKITNAASIFPIPLSQSYISLTSDLERLRTVAGDADASPVELYDECVFVRKRLFKRIETQECASCEQDALIGEYSERLKEVAIDILLADADTQTVMERRAAFSGSDLLIDNSARIQEALTELEPFLEGKLAEVLPIDAAEATSPDTDPEIRKVSSYRLVSRIARIGILISSVGAGFVATFKAINGATDSLQAIEFLAKSPYMQHALKVIEAYLGF